MQLPLLIRSIVYLCMCVFTYAVLYVLWSENNLWELTFSLCYQDPGTQLRSSGLMPNAFIARAISHALLFQLKRQKLLAYLFRIEVEIE